MQQKEIAENVRILVSPCRSGSSALLQALSQQREIDCVYQQIKTGLRTSGIPDHSIFYGEDEGEKITVNKETIGHSTLPDCTVRVFPEDTTIHATYPIFLLRDPVDTWNSWTKAGWKDIDLFLTAYKNTLDTFHYARSVSDRVSALLYEDFGTDPKSVFQKICTVWGIPFAEEMLQWQTTFGDDSSIKHPADIHRHLHGDVIRARTFAFRKNDVVIPRSEMHAINAKCRSAYEEMVALSDFRPQAIFGS